MKLSTKVIIGHSYENQPTLRYIHVVFSSLKHLVPQPAFKVGLHFGKIIIRRRTAAHSHMNVVKEIKAKINQGPRHRQSITLDVSFVQVPTSCSHDQACNLFFQFAHRA